MRFKNILVISVMTLFAAGFSLANSNEKISIALIADKASGLDKSPLVSLLEVELSQKKGIQLLERAAIDKIIEEQKLNASGLLDRNTAIKIGKLLRADAFIILSLESQMKDANDLVRVRISETAHGLRLADFFEQSEKLNPRQAIERIVQKIENVLNKINQPDEKLIPVGIVDIHRVELGEQYKMLERILPTILSVRLSLEPQIIMLEREDLKVLLNEKLQTEGEDSQFWNSAILIDGYIRSTDDQLEMHLNLKQATGDTIKSFTIEVEPNEPAVAIAQATTEIIQQLQNSPPSTKWNPELEAEAFYKQGQMLSFHGRYEKAVNLFETAHALQPQNVYYTGALFERIWDIRREIENKIRENEYRIEAREERQKNNPQDRIAPLILKEPKDCPYSDMEIVQLVASLVRQIRDSYEKDQLSTLDIYDKFSKNLGFDPILTTGYFVNSVSINTEQIRQVNRENRRIWIETYDTALQEQLIRDDNPKMNNTLRFDLAWISSDDPNELLKNLQKSFTEFVMPLELGGKILSTKERELYFNQFRGKAAMSLPVRLQTTFLKNVSEEFPTLFRQYLIELDKIDNPDLNPKIDMLLSQTISNLSDSSDKVQAQDNSIKKTHDLVEELTNQNKTLDSETRKKLLKNIAGSLIQNTMPIKYIGTFDERRLIWEKIFLFLIEQKDIDSLSEFGIYTPFDRDELRSHPEIYVQRNEFFGQILELFESRKAEKKINSVIALIKDEQFIIKRSFPELEISQTPQILRVTMLLKKDDWFESYRFSGREFQVTIKDKMVWVAFTGSGSINESVSIGLVGINLENKRISALWGAEYPYVLVPSIGRPNLCGLIIGEKTTYLAATSVGILEFPGNMVEGREFFQDPNYAQYSTLHRGILEFRKNLQNNKQVSHRAFKVYKQENGLPSLLITSIVQENDKLWVAYGERNQESGLGIYDPKTEHWETVFCSTLQNNILLGAGKAYIIYGMKFVSPDKLFFLVYDPSFPKKEGKENLEGLWKMNTKTQEIRYLNLVLAFKPDQVTVENFGQEFWYKPWKFIVKFDPDAEKSTMVVGNVDRLMNAYLEKNIPFTIGHDIFLPESFMDSVSFGPYHFLGNLDLSTSAIHTDKLWARLGESQIIIAEKGKRFEEAKIIDNNLLDGEPVHRFVSTPYGLVGIGEGTVGLIEDKE
ncbi:MAG: hypothetical protein JW787_17450 [Sedimentisphaerales bacterium]|nr:hypothetical protein [Sedimentisphaerales bacterium]